MKDAGGAFPSRIDFLSLQRWRVFDDDRCARTRRAKIPPAQSLGRESTIPSDQCDDGIVAPRCEIHTAN